MNLLGSECSSGCESGWTLYFENSHLPSQRSGTMFLGGNVGYGDEGVKEAAEDEDEEDLSMLSDASSGPPQFQEQEEVHYNKHNGCFFPASKDVRLEKNGGKRQKIREQERTSFLDDTASSPVINFSSKNNCTFTNNQPSMESILDVSQACSANHFEGRSAFQDHYDFLQYSSLSGNQLQKNQLFEGNRMGMR